MQSYDDTKSCLIKSAQKLFASYGFNGTSVKQIADKAKVNISLVSYHFGGKEGLYKACLDTENENLKFFDSLLHFSSKEEYRIQLKIFTEGIIASSFAKPEVSRIIRRDIEKDPIDPIILEVFKKTIVPLFERIIDFIKKGQDAGYVRKDINANEIAVLYLGAIQHSIRTDHLRKRLFGITIQETSQRNTFINSAIEMFFNGFDRTRA